MIIAFIGDNSFAREQAAREFIDSFVGAHGTHAVDRFAATDIEPNTLTGAVTTTPFLSQRRLVIVRDISANKQISDQFEDIVQKTADTTDLVIIESRVDGRSKYLQILRKMTDCREFAQLDGAALVDWILQEVQAGEGTISRADAQYLVDRVGTNQQLVSMEVEKLLLYSSQITRQSIDALTEYSPQSSIFAMLETAFAGNAGKAMSLYQEQRAQGMEPQAILGMIAWQLHILALVKAGHDKDPAEIAAAAKLNPFVVRKSQTAVKRLSFAELSQLLELAADTDYRLKTSKINADDAVSALLLACAK
jgi:DNA polymerase III subunit delta